MGFLWGLNVIIQAEHFELYEECPEHRRHSINICLNYCFAQSWVHHLPNQPLLLSFVYLTEQHHQLLGHLRLKRGRHHRPLPHTPHHHPVCLYLFTAISRFHKNTYMIKIFTWYSFNKIKTNETYIYNHHHLRKDINICCEGAQRDERQGKDRHQTEDGGCLGRRSQRHGMGQVTVHGQVLSGQQFPRF